MLLAVLALSGCGASTRELTVRGADDVQVLTPAEVAALRPSIDGSSASDSTAVGTAIEGAAADTVPQNEDDRPPELRLFEAIGELRSCIEDKGFEVVGDLRDRTNPAYQDPDFAEAVTTCAARADIINILAEVEATRAELTPDEVRERNEAFIELRECLEDKGWTVETVTTPNGLLTPTLFQNAEGELDERAINQCISALNLEDR